MNKLIFKKAKKIQRVKLFKELAIASILCLLLFQPANDINSQSMRGVGKKNTPPRDNSTEIKKTNEVLDSALTNLKQLEKSIDRDLRPKVIYKTKYVKSKPDTIYLLVPDSSLVPDFSIYKLDAQPDTVFVHDTVTVLVNKKSWFNKLFNKK